MAQVLNMMLIALGVYLLVGAVFAVVFVVAGIGRVDAAAAASPKRFRLIVMPGCAALWPVMLAKWLRAAREGGAP